MTESLRLRAHAHRVGQESAPVPTAAQERSPIARPSIFSCHFLALANHQLGQKDQARAWFAKAVLPKDAPWDEAMIDRYLRREVEAEVTGKK